MFSHAREYSSEVEPATLPGTSWTSWTSHLTSSDPESAATTPPSDSSGGPRRDSRTRDDASQLQEMGGGIEAPGKRRALQMLFTVPDRFIAFCHFNQTTFFELSDWILANVPSQVGVDISVEESLFMFLDVVARGNSFDDVAYRWHHDLKLTQRYVCLSQAPA